VTLVSKKVGDPNEAEPASDEEGSEILDEFGMDVESAPGGNPTTTTNAKRIRLDRQQHGE
jgi:hypothetical protein